MIWDFRHLLAVFQCRILKHLMRGLLQPWTRSSIIPKRKISLEEQKAQKEDRFLRGRQIAYLIYEQFRVTGTDDSVENYTDLFTIVLRNDDIQEFDSKWDGILSTMTKIPHDDILEGLYKLRIRESDKLKTVLELYDLETHQKKLGPDYHRLKAMMMRSIEQEIRNKKWTLWEERRGQESGNKTAYAKVFLDVVGNGKPTGSVWKETIVVSATISISVGKVIPSNTSPNSFMQQSERTPSRTRSPRGKSPSGRMSRWPCKYHLGGTCNNSFCERWHPPESVNTIHPNQKFTNIFIWRKATEQCARLQAHSHLHWDQCDWQREQRDAHRRVDRAALSTLHAVCRCVA